MGLELGVRVVVKRFCGTPRALETGDLGMNLFLVFVVFFV